MQSRKGTAITRQPSRKLAHSGWLRFLALAITGISLWHQSSFADCNPAIPPPLAASGVLVSTVSQTDYGRLDKSADCYLEAWPQTTEETAKLVSLAYQNHLPIRIQGAAHSINGNALPARGELVIHTSRLNQIAFNHIATVDVGAGLPIVLLKTIVADQSSFMVPIVNYGPVGPTIGGYISAGGLSPESRLYGGLWEHVYAVTLVTGYGKVRTITRKDPLFLFLFGSMGQLGIITQVRLMLLPDTDKAFKYPYGLNFRSQFTPPNGNTWSHQQDPRPSFWYNLLVPKKRATEAIADMLNLSHEYHTHLEYGPIVVWQIKRIHAIPPLVYNKDQSFLLVDLWLKQEDSPAGLSALNQVSAAFTQLVATKHYQRYVQGEDARTPSYYQQYFAPAIYSRFKQIKRQLDPEMLFDSGSVFTAQ